MKTHTPLFLIFSAFCLSKLAVFPAFAAEDDLTARIAKGKASYMTCAACHGIDGKGLTTNPPMAPSFIGSKLANGPAEVAAAIVLKGIQKTDSKYLGIMAPLGAALTDDQLADVLTYIRGSFGNKATPVDAADVKTWREKYKEVTASLPRAVFEKKAETLAASATPAPTPPAAPVPPAAETPNK